MSRQEDHLDLTGEIISHIVDRALTDYRIGRDRATGIAMEAIEKHPKFRQLLAKGGPLPEILRSRHFAAVNRNARRKMYYELRQYNKPGCGQEELTASLAELPPDTPFDQHKELRRELALTHTSTGERLPYLQDFYDKLFDFLGSPETILDVGCGLHPLLFPFERTGKLRCYAALDKDRCCISALSAFAGLLNHKSEILYPLHWNINDNWKPIRDLTGTGSFDAAFMMKLVPVVARQQRHMLEILLNTPAKLWIITGSRLSMTKYVKIEGRERRFVNQFIEASGKKTIGEFSTENEFCKIAV